MNTEERKAFWEILGTLNGTDISYERETLGKAIKYPRYLYRFRPVSFNSLDGIRSNKMYFSSADHYDDPFDSFSHIDWNDVWRSLRQFQSNENQMEAVIDLVQKFYGASQQQIKELYNSKTEDEWERFGESLINDARKYIQSNELSICFSEEELNEVLWLKYAGNHEGFVVEYDLFDNDLFLCGKYENCTKCFMSSIPKPLYPVCYSDEKYNATQYIKNVLLHKAINLLPQNLQLDAMNNLPNMIWQRERIGLIKKKCHEYDKEWRMLLGYPYEIKCKDNIPYILWIPKSITLGVKTKKSERELIISLAKQAGVSQIYECYINNNDDLDKRLIYEQKSK